MNKPIFHWKYCDALCGMGKTSAAIDYAIDSAIKNDAKIVIVQPSKLLIDQTYSNLTAAILNLGIEVPQPPQGVAPHRLLSVGDQHEVDAAQGHPVDLVLPVLP